MYLCLLLIPNDFAMSDGGGEGEGQERKRVVEKPICLVAGAMATATPEIPFPRNSWVRNSGYFDVGAASFFALTKL